MARAARNNHERMPRRAEWLALGSVIFFLVYYLCVWLVIDPRLIHHNLGIFTPFRNFAFDMRWPFFSGHLVRAGGLVEYATRLLTAFYAIGWCGALVITATAWCTGLFAERLSRRAGWSGGYVLTYVAAAMVLVLHMGYGHPLRPLLSLLVGLGGFAIYVRLAPDPSIKRLSVCVLLFLAVYQIAGVGSLLFSAMVAVDELLVRRQRAVAMVALACGLVVPWAFGTSLGLSMERAYAGFLFSHSGVSPERWRWMLALNLFFPAVLGGVALLVAARARVASRAPNRKGRKGTRSANEASRHSRFGGPRTQFVTMAVSSCVIGALAWGMSRSFTRTVLEIDYYSQHEQWTEALKAADGLPANIVNLRCDRNVLLALYHTGQLGDDMCRYNLRLKGDLFYTSENHEDLGFHYQESRLLLEIGQVNEAERSAYEALELSGPQPAVLRQLATISIVKGRVGTAKMFLHALALQPLQRRAARDLLECVGEKSRLEDAPRIVQIRADMTDRDRVVRHKNLEDFLLALLDENPHNKMAFEVLMAHYLGTRHPGKVVANLSRLKELGYARVPRHYQEAWLVAMGWPDSPPPTPGFELDSQVFRSSRQFRQIVTGVAQPDDAAIMAWEAGLGDSYFFYFTYGFSIR